MTNEHDDEIFTQLKTGSMQLERSVLKLSIHFGHNSYGGLFFQVSNPYNWGKKAKTQSKWFCLLSFVFPQTKIQTLQSATLNSDMELCDKNLKNLDLTHLPPLLLCTISGLKSQLGLTLRFSLSIPYDFSIRILSYFYKRKLVYVVAPQLTTLSSKKQRARIFQLYTPTPSTSIAQH